MWREVSWNEIYKMLDVQGTPVLQIREVKDGR